MRPRGKDFYDEASALVSLIIIVTLAAGAIIGIGLARVVGWGQCP